MSPGTGNCIPDEQLVSGIRIHMSTDTCRRIQVPRPGYLCTVYLQHNYYSFMSRPTCILLYPATDGRQTGDNFVADTRSSLHIMSTATSGYNKWIHTTCIRQHVSCRCKRSLTLICILLSSFTQLGLFL